MRLASVRVITLPLPLTVISYHCLRLLGFGSSMGRLELELELELELLIAPAPA